MTSSIGSNYHGFSDLAALKKEAAESPREAIMPVARQFESVFLNMMLKSMRETVGEGGLFDNESMKTYQGMFDNQLALSLSQQGGIGLAESIAKQLAPEGSALQSSLHSQSAQAAAIKPPRDDS
ncbi:flagellar protein FlgJ [Paraperlucidibaca baekdonensis]|uniref:Flagellar protein FlgJ n=1 Tax=Paraperlucidibaca baekdonensis TaxID=748120 RepID=A0A3E0H3F4_9GAMM|nr:rod-binding protein [Paraperlucidibaca baekdonensis]REH36747.1 flagellar protein FlgJ [Paraperlucidibaca baekdonensis]